MGTPNFARPSNASKYFVVLASREENQKVCPECGAKHPDWEFDLADVNFCLECDTDLTEVEITSEYVYPDEWECDDLISNIGYSIKEQGGIEENERIGNDRSYGIQSLGYIYKTKTYADVQVKVIVKAVLQSAYYEGATLDYLIYVKVDGESFDYSTSSRYDSSINDILESVSYYQEYNDLNRGLIAIMKPKITTFIEQSIEELAQKVEVIFEEYTEHKLACNGVFSNGEAIYSKVD